MTIIGYKLGTVLGLGFLSLVLTQQAHATIELKLTNGLATVDVKDGDALDSCPAANCVTYNGAVGNWTINVSTGTSNAPGGFLPILDLNTLNTAGAGAGALNIETSQKGYTPASSGFVLGIGGTITRGGTVSTSLYGATTNTIFDYSHLLIGPLTYTRPLNFSNPTFNVTGSSNGPVSANPYALTMLTTIDFGSNPGSTSFDASVDPVPEPAVVTMLGGILLCTVGAIRRRARRAS